MSYIVFGMGGHAKVVLDILKAAGSSVIGVMDDNSAKDMWNGLPNLGGMGELDSVLLMYPDALFLVAVGNNSVRKMLTEKLQARGAKFGRAIHPTAIIGSRVELGEGSVVMPSAVINVDSWVGKHVIINTSATIDHDCKLGDFVHISPGVHLAGSVVMEELSHAGIGSSVIQGISIGRETVIGAGACVIRNLPDRVVAVGCPAKPVKTL